MNFRPSLIVTAVMTASLPAIAQQHSPSSDEATTRLNQVVVSAMRTDKELKDVAGSVAVIDSTTIEDELVHNIEELVRYEPGVQVTSGRGGPDGFVIRGVGGNRVKITVDGVNQPQQIDAGGDFLRSQRNFIDVETLKAVEIVKGPASSLFGSDAVAGLVAFRTKNPSDLLAPEGDDSHVSIKAGYASVDEGFSETLSLANRTGKLETLAIYTRRDHKETDTHSGTNTTGVDRGQANPSDTGLNSLLTKAQYQLGDNHRIGVTGEFFQSKTDVKLKTLNPATSTGKDENNRYRVGFEHNWQAGQFLFDTLQWQIDWQQSQTQMITNRPGYDFLFPNGSVTTYPSREMDYNYKEQTIEGNLQLNKLMQLGGLDHNLVYGLSASHTKVTNDNTELNLQTSQVKTKNYIPDTKAIKYGLFLQDNLQLTNRLNLTAGIRYDKYEFNPNGTMGLASDPEPAHDSEGSKVTGRIGALYDLTDSLSLFAQFSQGFKAPEYTDMYYAYGMGVIILANPDLKSEESDSFELGLRGETNFGNYEIVGFYNKYTNFIENERIGFDVASGKDIFQNINIGRVKIKGIEMKGELWLDDAINAPTGTTLRGTLAWAEGKNEETGEFLNSVAPLTAAISLGYDAPAGNWGGELHWTLVKGKSNGDVANIDQGTADEQQQFNPGGYGVVDVTAYYQAGEALTFRAGLFNITNKKHWHLNNVGGIAENLPRLDRLSQPGRNAAVSAEYVF